MGDFFGGLQHAAEQAYQGAAGQADALAGSTDEAVGRAASAASRGDVAGVADNLAGGLDEATGQATSAAMRGDLAGVADAVAGSTDEAFGRAAHAAGSGDIAGVLDNLAGGLNEAAGQIYQGQAAVLDAAAGTSDEAWHRQFDDTPGGGIGDEALNAGEDVVDAGIDGASYLLGGLTDTYTEVGQNVIGDWFQWWMIPAGLLALVLLFKDEIVKGGEAYATGGASLA
ncbi:hypothetical protein [Haloarchaeobius sp. DYHT-AS-18]|uniref:hypothetical protein n=1 Tax=Haloarchaeobius sp. DYHT-AS-18 TaxID=3446117 RepID=UPI003EB7CC27